MERFKTKCNNASVCYEDGEHILTLYADSSNISMFGSKIIKKQFEKIESVLSKRYIKLPFGIRILI